VPSGADDAGTTVRPEDPGRGCRRTVVVDNDPIMRAGTQVVLASEPRIELVAAVDHDEALSWRDEWLAVDVAVIDASDQRREADHFPGVDVVRTIRAAAPAVVTIILTGQYLHPGLRRRMWEAGADFFYPRDEGMSEEELVSVVLSPASHRRTPQPSSQADALGITAHTRVNALLDRLGAPEIRTALLPEHRKKADPHGERSRWWNRVRSLASGKEGLVPVKSSGEAALDLDAPSITQLRRFWAAMTRAGDGSRSQRT